LSRFTKELNAPSARCTGSTTKKFTTLEGFFAEISRVRIPGTFAGWGRNLDAFDDICIAPDGLKETSYSSCNSHSVLVGAWATARRFVT
jgi:hypothetical protein